MGTVTSTSANETLTEAGVVDTTYVFYNSFGVDTISDGGGANDLVDLSAVTIALVIDLISTPGQVREVTSGTNTVEFGAGSPIEHAIGGSGNDSIKGTSGANSLTGGAGNDTIEGRSGNDTIDGGAGNDTYSFDNSWGVDSIEYSSGTDTLNFLQVSAAITINLTSSGSAEVTDGINTIDIASGFIENVIGGDRDDLIYGNSGNNNLNGGNKNDTLDGGDGNDIYSFDSGFDADTIIDSSGNDTVDLSATNSNSTINLNSSVEGEITNPDGVGGSSVNWGNNVIENAIGGTAVDLIYGNDDNNSLTGNAGNDTFYGNAGNDTIDGGAGDDTFDGGAGNDSYKFLASWGADQISDDSSGRDTFDFSGMATSVTVNLSTNPGADEVTAGTNTINWTGNLLENATGGSASDKITGNLDSNYVIGGGGDDTMDGDVGSDTYEFSGTWGADSIIDSAGAIDHLILSAVSANLVVNLASGGVGDEVTDGTNTVNWATGVVIEKVTTGSGNDTIYGNSSNNLFEAGSGNDSIEGGSGSDSYVFGNSWGVDTIYDSAGLSDAISLRSVTAAMVINLNTHGSGDEVSSGANTINWMSDAIEQVYSGSGADTITGNSARNVIYGGSGNDTIDGDLGNDTYQFANSWGTDTIIDGGGTDDSVDLSSVTTALTINLGTDGTGDEVTAGGTNTINWTGDVANAIEKAYAGSGNDLIYGSSANNFLSGGSGNDTFYGLGGNDIYVSSASAGTDISTVGADIINDASGADDKLSLRSFTIGAGPNQATFTAQDFNTDTFVDDLLVSFASGGSVTIKNYFDNSNADDDFSNPGTGCIETLVFSDDTSVPFAQVQTLIA